MTPEEAADFEAANRYSPKYGEALRLVQESWRGWCAARGQQVTAPAPFVALWLPTLRRKDGTPLPSERLQAAALAVDALPERRTLPAVARHPDVLHQVAAGAAHRRTRTTPVLTIEVARPVLAAPPPTTPSYVVNARQLVAAASTARTPVACQAGLAVCAGRLTGKERAAAVQTLEYATAGTDGALLQDPASMDPAHLATTLRLLDEGVTIYLRTRAGILLSWHCALDRRDLTVLTTAQLTLTPRTLELDLPGGPARAVLAGETALCAVRAVQAWTRHTGPSPWVYPATALGRVLDRPLTPQTFTLNIRAAGERAGVPGLSPASLVAGYIHTAYRQGATIADIVEGLRHSSYSSVQNHLRNILDRTATVAP